MCFQMVIHRTHHIFHSSQVTFLRHFSFFQTSSRQAFDVQLSYHQISSRTIKKKPQKIQDTLWSYSDGAFEERPMHRIEQKAWWRAAVVMRARSLTVFVVTFSVVNVSRCFTPSAKRSHTRSPCTSFPFLSAVLHQFLQHRVKFRDAAATQSDDLTAGMTDDWNMRWCKSDAHVPMRPYPLPSPTDMVL